MNKRQYITITVEYLKNLSITNPSIWAKVYVASRMEFFYLYNNKKLIVSTLHGADFFTNLLFVMNGGKWIEQDENGKETEYSKNFRELAHE